jgi:hypothetical protein
VSGLHETSLQGIAGHILVESAVHIPAEHTEEEAQRLEDTHGIELGVKTQPPLTEHVSLVHGLESSHILATPTQEPVNVQVSLIVQLLPSLQPTPAFTVLKH